MNIELSDYKSSKSRRRELNLRTVKTTPIIMKMKQTSFQDTLFIPTMKNRTTKQHNKLKCQNAMPTQNNIADHPLTGQLSSYKQSIVP